MKRILIAPFHGAGHVFAHLAVAQVLREAGYEVYVYTIKPLLEYASLANCVPVESPLVSFDGLRIPPLESKEERRAWWHSVAEISAVHLLEVLQRDRIDAIISDPMHLGAALAAERSGLPWASLSTAPGFLQNWPKLGPRSTMGVLRQKLGLPATSKTYAMQCISPLRIILPWMQEFDAEAALPQAVHVGNLDWDPPGGQEPSWLAAFTREPTILVTTTSVSLNLAHYTEAFFGAAVAAIEAIGAKAIITTAGAELPSTIRCGDRIRVEKLVPHGWVVPRVRAIIGAGGWGTMSRALSAGVPVITVPLPIGRDQEQNGALCERIGVGFSILLADLSQETLQGRLERLLAENSPQSVRARDYARRVLELNPKQELLRVVAALV